MSSSTTTAKAAKKAGKAGPKNNVENDQLPYDEDTRVWYIEEHSIEKFVLAIRKEIQESKLPTVVITGILQGVISEVWAGAAQRNQQRRDKT